MLGETMKKPVYDSPEAAEMAFYSAFEDADLEGMMAVWARQAEIECIHPFGERLQGATSIRKSWQQLFSNGKQLRFQLDQISSTTDAKLAVHVLYENITAAGNTRHQAIATNVYRCGLSGWHMILHHASPASTQNNKTAESTENASALH
jgi:ketosteroid isomerase-like protein